MTQNICPICTKGFQSKEIVIEYWSWNGDKKSEDSRLGYFDCVLDISKTEENRDHPPS